MEIIFDLSFVEQIHVVEDFVSHPSLTSREDLWFGIELANLAEFDVKDSGEESGTRGFVGADGLELVVKGGRRMMRVKRRLGGERMRSEWKRKGETRVGMLTHGNKNNSNRKGVINYCSLEG